MRFVLPILVGLLAVVGAGSALIEWRDARALRGLDISERDPLTPEQEVVRLRRAAASTVGLGGPLARLSARLRREAERSSDPQTRVSLFCEALGAVGEAVHREPSNPAFLINWANLRQLLGRVECTEPYTTGDFRAVATRALAADPTNTRVLYAAAQLAAWTGDTAELDRLLNRFVSLKVNLRASESEFIFSNLIDAGRVERIIPARYPHVVLWSLQMRSRRPDVYREQRSTWGRLQLAALQESTAELAREAIPVELHRRRLLETVEVAAEPAVQQKADFELGELLRRTGAVELAGYFSARSQLEELSVVRALQRSDTRPAANSLVAWGFDEVSVLDEFYNTIGFFVPAGMQPRMVQLVTAASGGGIEAASLQVFASNDNATWSSLSDRVRVFPLTMSELSGVALQVDGGAFRYWKIHFGSADRSRLFKNSLTKLLKVYGVRWAE